MLKGTPKKRLDSRKPRVKSFVAKPPGLPLGSIAPVTAEVQNPIVLAAVVVPVLPNIPGDRAISSKLAIKTSVVIEPIEQMFNQNSEERVARAIKTVGSMVMRLKQT